MNIIITGASRGIGYETAKLLSKEHNVIAVSRSAEKNKIPGVTAISFDLENGNVKSKLLPEIKKHFNSVDVLINNAAAFIKKPFEELTRNDFEKIYSVNVFAVAELTQAILPMMNEGQVINIASVGGVQESLKFAGLSAYSSSKGALITLTECLAEEYKDTNVRFHAIAFGSVQTEMLEAAFPGYKAPLTGAQAAQFICDCVANRKKYPSGKILQLALSTP